MPTRVTRWSLLAVLLVFGVALMHTLGHPATGHDDGMHHAADAVVHQQQHFGSPVDGLFAASYPDDLSPAAMASAMHHSTPGPHGMDPSLMCLAVLTALLAAVVALAVSGRTARPVRLISPQRAAGRVVRGPPRSRAGLTLASLSVSRI
jgi:hypothetical protein